MTLMRSWDKGCINFSQRYLSGTRTSWSKQLTNLRVVSTLFNTKQESRLDLGNAPDKKLHCFCFQQQGTEKQTVFDKELAEHMRNK